MPTTPAKRDLFEIDNDSQSLPKDKAELFHFIVSKLLWVAKRGRLDIELSTRVSCSTEEDWKKLRRLLSYLQQTKDIYRILEVDDLEILQTWVYTSYATHEDMKSYIEVVMSISHDVIHNRYSKQKLNTKRSTEVELVGVSDSIPYILWTKRFLEEQGYNLKRNIFYQHNQSTMTMEKNGRSSAGENQDISISDISLSKIFFIQRTSTYNIVLLKG